eukprot:scaffold3783_cov77-Phaeocystis_antarctica.AAC.4
MLSACCHLCGKEGLYGRPQPVCSVWRDVLEGELAEVYLGGCFRHRLPTEDFQPFTPRDRAVLDGLRQRSAVREDCARAAPIPSNCAAAQPQPHVRRSQKRVYPAVSSTACACRCGSNARARGGADARGASQVGGWGGGWHRRRGTIYPLRDAARDAVLLTYLLSAQGGARGTRWVRRRLPRRLPCRQDRRAQGHRHARRGALGRRALPQGWLLIDRPAPRSGGGGKKFHPLAQKTY